MRILAAVMGAAAVAVVALGWLQDPAPITAAEAVRAAQGAYEAAGLRDAVVSTRPDAGTYVSTTGERIPVWKTEARFDGGTIRLWLARADAESVFLDDRAPDGASQLLTEPQFHALADHYENPAMRPHVRRNLVLTLAAACVALVALRLALLVPSPRLGRGGPTSTPQEAS